MSPTTEQLLLQGQTAIQDTLIKMAENLGSLRTKVENLYDQRLDAQDVHARCRGEVDERLADHERRLGEIEKLHNLQAGGARAAGWMWKALAGLLGLIAAALSILVAAGTL